MQVANNIQKDEFELNLSQKIQSIVSCQKEHMINSCMKCEKILNCQTRSEYVDAAYNSMAKGNTGGFDF